MSKGEEVLQLYRADGLSSDIHIKAVVKAFDCVSC